MRQGPVGRPVGQLEAPLATPGPCSSTPAAYLPQHFTIRKGCQNFGTLILNILFKSFGIIWGWSPSHHGYFVAFRDAHRKQHLHLGESKVTPVHDAAMACRLCRICHQSVTVTLTHCLDSEFKLSRSRAGRYHCLPPQCKLRLQQRMFGI